MSKNQDHEIVRRFHSGQSQREISRNLGIGRGRICRVIAEHGQSRDGQHPPLALPQPSQKRTSQLDKYEEAMRELLARYPDITGVRMHEHLQHRGYRGSYSSVRDRLRTVRPRPVQPLVERFETGPGIQAQMDYAQYDLDFTLEGRRRVYLFSYVLALVSPPIHLFYREAGLLQHNPPACTRIRAWRPRARFSRMNHK